MTSRRVVARVIAAASLAASVFLLAPASATADGTVTLDSETRAALVGLPRIDGTPLTAAALDGQVAVIAFFASWCPPCNPEFDHLKKVDRVYRERGVTVIAINIFEQYLKDPAGSRLKSFLAKKTAAFSVVGEGEAVAERFGAVDRIPTVFVFDRSGEGVMHFIHKTGATKTHATFEELAAAVEAVVQVPR